MTLENNTTPPGRCAATLPIEGREGAAKPQHSPAAKLQAKRLRKSLTGPEAKLWAHLKRVKTVDTHFRKQAAIGPYVADFACFRSRLIIEVDGEQHGFDKNRRRDLERTRFLQSYGFAVLRFWNHEVLKEMEAVLDTIYAALHGAAPPVSASKRRGNEGLAPSSPSMGEVASVASRRGCSAPPGPSGHPPDRGKGGLPAPSAPGSRGHR